jgi:hypothetical protein
MLRLRIRFKTSTSVADDPLSPKKLNLPPPDSIIQFVLGSVPFSFA